jgi:hypothetical protein
MLYNLNLLVSNYGVTYTLIHTVVGFKFIIHQKQQLQLTSVVFSVCCLDHILLQRSIAYLSPAVTSKQKRFSMESVILLTHLSMTKDSGFVYKQIGRVKCANDIM